MADMALGRIARRKIGLATTLLGMRQELRQQAAGAPARARRRDDLSRRETDEGRDLLGLLEIGPRGLLQRAAFDTTTMSTAPSVRACN
jgi:hypothetical protein